MLIDSALSGARSQEFHSSRHMCCDDVTIKVIWFDLMVWVGGWSQWFYGPVQWLWWSWAAEGPVWRVCGLWRGIYHRGSWRSTSASSSGPPPLPRPAVVTPARSCPGWEGCDDTRRSGHRSRIPSRGPADGPSLKRHTGEWGGWIRYSTF